MLKRYLLFLALLSLPVVYGATRRLGLMAVLPVALLGAWWAASPVSYPRWIVKGLSRALPLAGIESLAIWWMAR
jgi:hypothetical protein